MKVKPNNIMGLWNIFFCLKAFHQRHANHIHRYIASTMLIVLLFLKALHTYIIHIIYYDITHNKHSKVIGIVLDFFLEKFLFGIPFTPHRTKTV